MTTGRPFEQVVAWHLVRLRAQGDAEAMQQLGQALRDISKLYDTDILAGKLPKTLRSEYSTVKPSIDKGAELIKILRTNPKLKYNPICQSLARELKAAPQNDTCFTDNTAKQNRRSTLWFNTGALAMFIVSNAAIITTIPSIDAAHAALTTKRRAQKSITAMDDEMAKGHSFAKTVLGLSNDITITRDGYVDTDPILSLEQMLEWKKENGELAVKPDIRGQLVELIQRARHYQSLIHTEKESSSEQTKSGLILLAVTAAIGATIILRTQADLISRTNKQVDDQINALIFDIVDRAFNRLMPAPLRGRG